jgi:hypothetical protein
MDHPSQAHHPDHERLPAHHETYIYRAMIIVMTRRLARPPPRELSSTL